MKNSYQSNKFSSSNLSSFVDNEFNINNNDHNHINYRLTESNETNHNSSKILNNNKTASSNQSSGGAGCCALGVVNHEQHHMNNGVVKKASGFQSNIFEKLNEQRVSQPEASCDIAIDINGTVFYAHKCLLIASCDYFAAMLRSGMLETRQDKIELKGMSAQGLKSVLEFIYTGELTLSLNTVADLLRVVSHLQVKFAHELCEEYLCEQIDEYNCVDILNLIDLFSIKDIKNEIDLYIVRNFDKIVHNNQYKKLTMEQMCFYLKSHKLKLFPEINVFMGINYILYKPSKNKKNYRLLFLLISNIPLNKDTIN